MSVKYKIENAKINKKLIGDEITVSKINKTHGDGGKGPKGPKQPKAPKWFENFVNNEFKPFRDNVQNQFKSHGWTK